MSFRDINIRACYESGTCDIIEEFYEPLLMSAVSYDRIAGFFSSTSLAIASRGLYGLIKNNGKMRLITSPILSPDDADIIKKATECPDELTEIDLGLDLSSICDEFVFNHVKALGWMLQNGLLEIRLAVVTNKDTICSTDEVINSGLFHQKVGILKDVDGNELSFSGSINETASAWVNNDEEFKVFKAWTDSNAYFKKDQSRFFEIWNNQRQNIKVFDLPTAVKNKLIQYSRDFDIEEISISKYRKSKVNSFDFINSQIPLFDYQAKALNTWKDNAYSLLFEMATGTGKTRTAVAGIDRILKTSKKVIVIISTPQNTLSKQWKENEVEPLGLVFNRSQIIDGTTKNWASVLSQMLLDNSNGLADKCIIYTTHTTASSDKFTSIINRDLSHNTITLFVGDEVHWLGAKKLRRALLPRYNYRIGLSATPSRWFDDDGSKYLIQYFGEKNFVFSIHDALTRINPITGKHFLISYFYHISKVGLNADETSEYKKITKQIVQLQSKNDDAEEKADKIERLLGRRANIIKNAEAKYAVLEDIIDSLSRKDEIKNLLIFVSPQQIQRVITILYNKGIIFHKLTEAEGTRKERRYNGVSEREFIIQKFKSGDYQALIAIKCLDEGIDIPCADTGILMASSTNPREYVQRIGRIIRQGPDKRFAHLYDICVEKITSLDDSEQAIENSIRRKEIIRLSEIAENALNATEATKIIMSLND